MLKIYSKTDIVNFHWTRSLKVLVKRHYSVADPGEGPGPPIIFRPNWGAKDRKNFYFCGLGSPLISESSWPPPPPPHLKVWIRHCYLKPLVCVTVTYQKNADSKWRFCQSQALFPTRHSPNQGLPSLQYRRILGGRNLVRVRIDVAAIFDFVTVEDWEE